MYQNQRLQPKRGLTRRQTLLAALFVGSLSSATKAYTVEDCNCRPAPDCNDQCAHGGKPAGDGTQACICNPTEPFPPVTLLDVRPIGSLYMSTKPTDPSTLFGGTWESYAGGRVLIAAGGKYAVGQTGGEKTHTLTTSELPSHSHSGYTSSSTTSASSHVHAWGSNRNNDGHFAASASNLSCSLYWGRWYWNGHGKGGGYEANSDFYQENVTSYPYGGSSSGYHSHSVYLGSAGSGSSHNNMQPYVAVYIWRRTA